MFCDACGAKIPPKSRFCPECGHSLEEMDGQTSVTASSAADVERKLPTMERKGFADLGDYPELTRHLKKSRKIGKVAAVVMSIAPLIGFVLYAGLTGEMEMEEAMLVGSGVSGIFMIFSISFALKEKSRQSSWEGTVIDKKIEKRREKVTEYDETRMVMVAHQIMTIQREGGSKPEKQDFGGNEPVFNYYKVGDRVRHIPGTFHFEKYNKTGDDEVICVMCGGLYDMQQDTRCSLCRLPLLK